MSVTRHMADRRAIRRAIRRATNLYLILDLRGSIEQFIKHFSTCHQIWNLLERKISPSHNDKD